MNSLLGRFFALVTVSLIASIAFCQAQSKPDVAAQPNPAVFAPDTEEMPRTWIAQIDFKGQQKLFVWPRKQARNFEDVGGFVYQIPAVIDAEKWEDIAPKTTGPGKAPCFNFQIKFPNLPADALAQAKLEILKRYKNVAEKRVDDVVLYRDEIQKLEVYAIIPETERQKQHEILLAKQDLGHGGLPSSITASAPVTEADLDALTRNPRFDVKVVGTYMFTKTYVVTVSADLQNSICDGVGEQIGGKDGLQPSALFDRRAFQDLKIQLQARIGLVIQQSHDPRLNSHLDGLVANCLEFLQSHAEDVSLEELQGTKERVFIFVTGIGRLEMTPTEYRNLVTHFRTENEREEHFKKFSQDIKKLAKDNSEAEKFHSAVQNYLNVNGKSEAKFAIKAIPVGASGEGVYERSWASLDENERNEVKKLRSYLENETAEQEDKRVKDLVDLTGELVTKEFRPHDYGLLRVTNGTLRSSVSYSGEEYEPGLLVPSAVPTFAILASETKDSAALTVENKTLSERVDRLSKENRKRSEEVELLTEALARAKAEDAAILAQTKADDAATLAKTQAELAKALQNQR
jgi:hypothetical protein